jgi:hypothetical protein
VRVNGFACRNCANVDQAKRNIDPANSAAGPFGLDDPKLVTKNHFSSDGRQQDLMDDLHQAQSKHTAAASLAAAAYSSGQGQPPGNFVNLSA